MKDINELINKIHCGDCLEITKEIRDNSVDLVLTDPPYGIDYSRHIPNPKHNLIENDDSLLWLSPVLKEIKRTLKESGSLYIFCSWHNVDIFKRDISKHFNIRNMLIWNKGGMGMGDLATTYGCIYEICFYANSIPQILSGKRLNDIINITRSGNEYHPTQKPVALMKHLLIKSSKENDIVLDPFLGSGTTVVACKDLGRRFIGIEISPEYCKIAQKRIDDLDKQPMMLDCL